MTLGSTVAVRSHPRTTVTTIMSQVVKTIDIAELPDWLTAVKRRDAAATFHPVNDDWPVRNAKAIATGSSRSGRYIRSAARHRATSTRLDTGCTLRGS
jgi:hypothetical protein